VSATCAICPSCNQPIPPPHGITIDNLFIIHNDVAARVTPSGAAIMELLLRRIGKTVRHEQISSHLYDARLGDPAGDNCVKALMCKLRKHIQPTGLRIATDWGVGYRLDHPKLPPSKLDTVETLERRAAAE